jgi:predicted short-subunit dehydrogenase-like oxidoreductase (DUF2520 family)
MRSLSIIGAGRVGSALAISLPSDQFEVRNLIFRGGGHLDAVRPALNRGINVVAADEFEGGEEDILIFAVQDTNIRTAADWAAGNFDRVKCAFHTSGAHQSSLLDSLKINGAAVGSIHPLVSISDPTLGRDLFRGTYFCIEGENEAVITAKQIVEGLGGIPFAIDSAFKTLYHAAAVTACGHLVALLDTSFEMMNICGLEREEAKRILLPLVTSTIGNISRQETAKAMTGTFARADLETFSKHVAAINEHCSEEIMEIYLLLGERALQLAAEQGTSPDRVESMRSKVAFARSKLR